MTKRLYAEISKHEAQPDGTLKVWGYASTPDVDSDGEIITADAMKAALPDYLKFGAVREMHANKAAGTAIEMEVKDDGRTWFGAHIVDSEAVKKVNAKVYKGFSIGGKITSRDEVNKSTITGINLIEVSLVDRPANPEAVFTMFKAEGLEAQAQDEAVDKTAIADMAAHNAPGNALEDLEKAAVAELAELVKSGAMKPSEILAKATAAEAAAEVEADAVAGVEPEDEAAEIVEPEAEKAESVLPDCIQHALDDLEKAGARNSKGDQDKIQSMHDHAVALGADCGGKKAADTDDLAKAEALQKSLDDMTADLAKVSGERDDLAKRVAELEAMPEPAKGALKVVGKGDDVQEITKPEVEPVRKHDGTVDESLTLFKTAIVAAKKPAAI